MKSPHTLHRIFSSTVVDLTDTSLLPDSLHLRGAFSRIVLRLPVDARITLDVRSAFCNASLPGQLPLLLGADRILCGSQDVRAPKLHIQADCAFSALIVQMG